MTSLKSKIRITLIRLIVPYFLSPVLYAQQTGQIQGKVRPDSQYAEAVLLNKPLDGFRGIWYSNQPSADEFVYKYSGGLGTYPSNHYPFSIYAEEVDKTFFCYGGVNEAGSLIHSISYFDHRSNKVARPMAVLDKRTTDAHDNPVMSIDRNGFIWLFSTSHGVGRPSYILKSKHPYDISGFEKIEAGKLENGQKVPLDNFSYLQIYYDENNGFIGMFTHYEQKDLRYGPKQSRIISYMTSPDGVNWSEWKDLADIEEGHYQTSFYQDGKLATAFNFHPNTKMGAGLNFRTNLYYLESTDFGKTWQNSKGERINLPLTGIENDALAEDYQSKGLNVYINDLAFDLKGNPVILYLTSGGYEAGPTNSPRTWNIASWTGKEWNINTVTFSDNNYDMGSLYIEEGNVWRIIGPTESGPQSFNTGGEMAMWTSTDSGKSWNLEKKLTEKSEFNHSYARKPVFAHPEFYAFWADGHGRMPSDSRLYFSTKQGAVYRLPVKIKKKMVKLKPL